MQTPNWIATSTYLLFSTIFMLEVRNISRKFSLACSIPLSLNRVQTVGFLGCLISLVCDSILRSPLSSLSQDKLFFLDWLSLFQSCLVFNYCLPLLLFRHQLHLLCFQFTKANLPDLESLALFHSIPLHFTRIMDHIWKCWIHLRNFICFPLLHRLRKAYE